MEQAILLSYPRLRLAKMNLFVTVIILLVSLLPGLTQTAVPANIEPLLLSMAYNAPADPVSVIVQKTVNNNSIEQAVTKLGGTVTGDLGFIHSFVAKLPAGEIPLLAANQGIRWVSFDAPVAKTGCLECMGTDDPTNYTSAINADKVWNNNLLNTPWLQGQGIGVVVLDSGINPGLINFTGIQPGNVTSRVISAVKINNTSSVTGDVNGHGTLVAGVIGSNGKGTAGKFPGVAPQANLISVKIADDNGASSVADVLSSLQWIYTNSKKYNIRVLNISFNSSVSQSYNVDPLDAGVEALWFSGITVVVSAGNNGTANLFAPANDPFVITVGAAKNMGTTAAPNWITAPFSAYGVDGAGGLKPDLVTPGTGIVSDVADSTSKLATNHKDKLVGTSYMKVAGTSFAAPQVSGAVALLLQSSPFLTPDQVKYRLKATTLKNVPQGLWDRRTPWAGYNRTTAGAGFLDVQAAVNQSWIIGRANVGVVPST